MRTALLRGLLELHEIPGDEFPWDPSLGDAFNAREAELERRVGRSAAGWLSAGRPRREAFRVALRLTARAGVRELHDALVDQAAALAATRARRAARSPPTTPISSRRSRRPSATCCSPTPIRRSATATGRARRTRPSALSVAGAGGSAGSRWALDRARLAELLGCDGLVEHAKDAAWQADVYLELLATLAIAATHQSQLGQDFEIYASQEFGLVELADAHSRASALMPQKKNPYALAAIRTQAGQAAGDVAAALVALHTGSARTDHFHLLNGTVPRALDEAVAIARLTASVLDGFELQTARFEEIARDSFVTAADVADVLALHGRARLPQRAQGGRARRPRPRRGGRTAVGADAGAPGRGGRGGDRPAGRDRRRDASRRARSGRVRRRAPADGVVVRGGDGRDARRASTRRSLSIDAGARLRVSANRLPRQRCSHAPASSPTPIHATPLLESPCKRAISTDKQKHA